MPRKKHRHDFRSVVPLPLKKRVSVRKQPTSDGTGVSYLVAFASLPLAVGQEAGEEWQVDAVMQRQEEVVGQLEAGGKLGEQLPHTVQEEQEDGRLHGARVVLDWR